MMLLTRSPFGRATGRKMVLNTARRCLAALGVQVDMVVIGPEEGAATTLPTETVTTVPRPGLARTSAGAAWAALSGRQSLNESLYASGAVKHRLVELVRQRRPQFLVADMVRTAPLAEGLGVPWLLDMDDLLSARYELQRTQPTSANALLGYYGQNLPGRVGSAAGMAASSLLGREARLLRQRELYWARRADAVSLVSATEAQALARRAGRAVWALPMAVDPQPDPASGGRFGPERAVFVGGMDYQPNLDALRYFRDRLASRVPAAQALALDVIGHVSDAVRREFEDGPIQFLGYQSDLLAVLQRYRLFVAPMVSGSGVKTKVLEAMACGLAVLTTPAGAEGLGARSGEQLLVFDDPGEFAALLGGPARDPDRLATLGAAGREHVAAHFSTRVVTERWSQVIDELTAVGAGVTG